MRPRPRPSLLRAEPFSSRENALNSSGLKLELMPGPVSVIVMLRARPRKVALSETDPFLVNFRAFWRTHSTALAKEPVLTIQG